MERPLIHLFKEFFEKTCLPIVKQNYSALKEWLYFSSILSQDIIDYMKIEKYVHSLPSAVNVSSEFSNRKPPQSSNKYAFQRKTSLNEGMLAETKPEEIKFPHVTDEVSFPTSTSTLQYEISPKSKEPLKDQEATKQILFGLNNLHLMFVEHQYQF